MKGYKIANLDLFLEQIGEEKTNSILANYFCPLNPDVEDFLKHKAIPFSRQGLSKTHLVFASYNDQWVLVGYFALASKTWLIPRKNINAKLNARLRKFAQIVDETNTYQISAPLIAQLGKNYCNSYNRLISGDELLKIACDRVRDIQCTIGGKIAYLECEDKPQLRAFYERNGFSEFNKRNLNKSDLNLFKSDYLVQMLKYF